MPRRNYELRLLAGPNREGTFPPGLNTNAPATDIRSDESPDCYGLDIGAEGRIKTGTIPTGTARVARTVTLGTADGEAVASVPFLWHYNRLWNITKRTAATASNILKVGAKNYDAKYFQQGPDIAFVEDAQTILALVPFGEDSMAVMKTTGSYMLNNLNDTRGTHLFQRTPLIQELALPALADVAELDGVLYVCNAAGLFSYYQGKTTELTAKVGNGLTNFASVALTANMSSKYIIGTAKFAYDVTTEKLFRWSSTSFRYTTPQWHLPDYAPVAVDALVFDVEHGDTSTGSLTYQVKYDDGPWSDSYTVDLDEEQPGYTTAVTETLEMAQQSRRFQLRLTALSSNKYIKSIRVESSDANFDSYAEQSI